MKYLYVCVSSSIDFYLEQTFASIVTLKANTPSAFVTLLTDNLTMASLQEGRDKIKALCDEIVVKNFETNISQKKRSRLLKTNMRNYVDGDFLYIDGDTFVFDNLSEIEKCPHIIAGVQDMNCQLSKNRQYFTHQMLRRKICQDSAFLQSEYFFNSGVLWTRDNEENRTFFKDWSQTYIEYEKKGISQDQPTLSFVNCKHGYPIYELDGSWNCQLESGAQFFNNAKIFHYFASQVKQESLNQLFKRIRLNKFNDCVQEYIRNNYKRIAFNFGPCTLSRGPEHEIQATAFYRLIVFLFQRHRKIFNMFERLFQLGRGKGFFFNSR